MDKNCQKKLLIHKDIKAIYENRLKMNHDDYTHIEIDETQTKCSTNQKKVNLNLMNDSDKVSLLIERIYHKNYSLYSTENKGNVAYHDKFILKDDYIGKGIAKAIHQNELSVYKNKIDEIQLHAVCDGIISWIRLGFYIVKDSSKYLLYENLMRYLEEVKMLSDDKLDEIENLFLKNDNTIDENSFRTIDKDLYFKENNNFTEWFLKQNIDLKDEEKKPTIAMYKEVA